MSLALHGFPGWRKIGWHIGKKLHDILHPPDDDGPLEEELRARRLKDVLKGFAYFNTVDEIEEWTPLSVDPLQRANIPMCARAAQTVATCAQQGKKTRTILCHDFKGGYVDSEAVRPNPSQNSIYSCQYLQNVDAFIYFSHHLVTVPPPSWTNCLHTNGVKSLGTFIMEPQSKATEELLRYRNGKHILAQRLAAMTDAFGFDGWLLNFEKEFEEDLTNLVASFIENLKFEVGPHRLVLWYDALSIHNKVDHQNGLTHENAQFTQKSDGLFTNYMWDLQKLERSCRYAEKCGIPYDNLFFGIDVWAQNDPMPGPLRITFPEKGGGGSNTGLAMRTLADSGVSTAIFAPGWTHEHFSTDLNGLQSISDKVNQSMWEGRTLPQQLLCGCKGRPHHTSSYQLHSILNSSIQYPAGSSEFFYTNFRPAFRISSYDAATRSETFAHLGLQSIHPTKACHSLSDQQVQYLGPLSADVIHTWLPGNEGELKSSLSIKLETPVQAGSHEPRNTQEEHRLCLYNLAIECKEQLSLQMVYTLQEFQDAEHYIFEFGLYFFIIAESGSTRYEYLPLKVEKRFRSNYDYFIQESSAKSRLIELGVYCRCRPQAEATELFQCHSLSVVPTSALTSVLGLQFSITNLRITRKEIINRKEERLEWGWIGDKDLWPKCLPLSEITGPFSHFVVLKDEKEIGVSQSLAFPLYPEGFELVQGGSMTFTVQGICFAGIGLRELAIASLDVEYEQ
ncbi:hypothetical protein MMC10_001011 [Thelotrema lepadinum]|nr:hypothetical protein [Thelotrema lepadinum]